MNIVIKEVKDDSLLEYSQIPISFKVKSKLDIQLIDDGLGGINLLESKIDKPYIKDYDIYEKPTSWKDQFDISNWGIFLACDDNEVVGGATLAYNTEGVNMLEGKKDITVLWDIRVKPKYRGFGIGSKLFNKAISWSRERKCKLMKVETQNINVSACKFYKAKGSKLGVINRYGYFGEGDCSDEVMMIWYYDLRIND